MSDAASRAAARKAKILARGNTGLAKLAQSARGEEAQALYADDFKPSPFSTPQIETPPPLPPASSASASNSNPQKGKPSWAPESNLSSNSTSSSSNARSAPTAGHSNGSSNPNLTAEQQAMSAQLEAMMSMFGGGPPGDAGTGLGPDGEMPDMGRLLSQMMGMGAGAGGAGMGDSQRLLGDLDDPAGLGGMGGMGGMGGLPSNLFGGPGSGDAGPGAGVGDMPFSFPGFGGTPQRKSKSEKYFPIVHFISIILLSIFTIVWWEPKIKASTSLINAIEGDWSTRWSGLNGRAFAKFGNVEVVPIFWAWTTLELILQTSRFMIFKSPPPPHSLISNFLPLLPPKISRPVLTGSRYFSLLAQTYKDGCLLVFTLGMTVVLSQYLNGAKVF
ncbi:uncharacterized protein I303_101668 [Kwoniella dejecticola CBS 10117]|uniref:Golgi to ER traffic protein 2 n=1 Tax=Kwoniella dejecticola CBS 10117 TaxID=1296121 RepID=A0A1A6AD47_9TREE|nr:uncharacterized protein I303_02196 [Kwoniella dejecticola CBS 10117]OBR87980.1 hypothetical protein I303_02196 [Kwoniella dejecticola CBS 10117]